MRVSLKAQDVLVAVKLAAATPGPWSYPQLAAALGMSASAVHASVRRCVASGLLARESHVPNRAALLEFLVHGLKYAFPIERHGITRGLPTAHAAPPLRGKFAAPSDLPPVWADPNGSVRGEAIEPLYP